MASIRRTLSPAYHDRSYQNGGTSVPAGSPSYELPSDAKPSPKSPYFTALPNEARRFAGVLFLRRRKGHQGLRLWVFRSVVFFFIGFLLGMTPFGHVDDIKSHDFSFVVNPPPASVKLLDRSRVFETEGFVVEAVKLGVDMRLSMKQRFDFLPRKHLIVVTPTYNRALQAFFLHRLSQLLRLVPPPLLWIVVEMNSASMETAELLRGTGVMYRHLVCTKNSSTLKDRGVHQRNTALEHIERHKLDGIVYFADDDNAYSLGLFESLRGISRFGTWPVAMLAPNKNKAILEGPVCNGSHIIGWHTNEKSKRLRRFHVDMSGFAFNSSILWDPKRWKRPTANPVRQLDTVKEGFQETTFIEQLVEDESRMEGMLHGCSRIMNWHLHLEVRDLFYPKSWLLQKNLDTDIPIR